MCRDLSLDSAIAFGSSFPPPHQLHFSQNLRFRFRRWLDVLAFAVYDGPVITKIKAMNWEMISAVGQMLGAIGVIISIIYLAAQIRNQNKESQRAAMNVLTTHWSDLNRTLVENPEMAVLWLRALQCFDDLDAKSKLRF